MAARWDSGSPTARMELATVASGQILTTIHDDSVTKAARVLGRTILVRMIEDLAEAIRHLRRSGLRTG